jgi:8-oxo-dGTP pyrophosphatase MutT (NUDIX family)
VTSPPPDEPAQGAPSPGAPSPGAPSPGAPSPGASSAAAASPPRAPAWLQPLLDAVSRVRAEDLSAFVASERGTDRESAVLMLFGEGPHGPDLLFIQRSAHLRSHAGQPAFPGGRVDPGDGGPVGAALREAGEETGLDPAGVQVLRTLPALWLPPSGFVVTPVLAWWREPSDVHAASEAEVESVRRVPVAELADPANRFRVRHPSGYTGPGFAAGDMFIWGFTAGLVDRLLALGGWEQPWDHERLRDLPDDALRLAMRQREQAAPDLPPADENSPTSEPTR